MTQAEKRPAKPASRTGRPKPAQVKAARLAAGLTQTAAAELVHTTLRVWQQWEAGERTMHEAFWELFCIKAARLKEENSKSK